MKKINVIIFTMITTITFAFAGCSQGINEKKVGNSVTKTNIKLTGINAELDKEVKANYSFKEPFVALDPYGTAPLSALIIFATTEETGVKMKVSGHDKAFDLETSFGKAKKHILPVYGLYAGEDNKILLTLDDGTTKELTITTEDIDAPYKKANVVKADIEKMEEGFTFVSFGKKSPGGLVAAAYDYSGEIRWALKSDVSAWDIYRLKNGRLLVASSKKLSEPYYSDGIREIDLMGKTYVEYMVPGGYHHSAVELPKGNIIAAAQEANSGTGEDIAYEIDSNTGEVVKTFDLKDVLPIDDGSSLNTAPGDWFHINSLWYDDKTKSVIFSGRNVDGVASVDYESGKLKWVLGNPEGWTKVDKKYFFKPVGDNFEWQYAQHATMITPEGNVFLFDNGVFRAKKINEGAKLSGDQSYSRGVIYKIDEKNMTIEQTWQYGKECGAEWYSYYIGDVDYLSENHYLINSGGQLYDAEEKTHEVGFKKMMDPKIQQTSSIVELKDDKLIYEMQMNYNIFAAERMNFYDEKGNFDLYTEGRKLGDSN